MKKKLLKIFIPAIILLFILVIALIIFKRLKLSNTIKENFIPNNLQVEEFESEPYYIIS
jgi:flagellar basal body-associated protein FliL